MQIQDPDHDVSPVLAVITYFHNYNLQRNENEHSVY